MQNIHDWWQKLQQDARRLPDIDFGGERVLCIEAPSEDAFLSEAHDALEHAERFAIRIPLTLTTLGERRLYRMRVWIGSEEQYAFDRPTHAPPATPFGTGPAPQLVKFPFKPLD